MAIFPIIHKETSEKKVIQMSVHEIQNWYKDNPEWKRDWSEGCASAAEVGEWKDKLAKKYPGWNDVLTSAKKAGASQNNIKD